MMLTGQSNNRHLHLFTTILMYTLTAVHGLRREDISPTKAMATSTIFPHTIIPSLSSILPTSPPTKEDPCREGEDVCKSSFSTCENVEVGGRMSFRCVCAEGMIGDGRTEHGCIDIDECINMTSSCNLTSQLCENTTPGSPCNLTSQVCENTIPGYRCHCKEGFEGNNCTDVDECESNSTNNCDLNKTVCLNTPGNYQCNCRYDVTARYTRQHNGSECVDVDECASTQTPGGVCGGSVCTNTDGSYVCGCPQGYTFNPHNLTCTDINECLDDYLHTCPTNISTCVNTLGSYQCACVNNATTFPITTCEDNEDGCRNNTLHEQPLCCEVDNGSHCFCEKGLHFLNNSCVDINECLIINGGCHHNCNNTHASFVCSCFHGYKISVTNSSHCDDINECNVQVENGTVCGMNSTCINLIGSYHCQCEQGFTRKGEICMDEDECENEDNPCQQLCHNTEGSFRCGCRKGFKQNIENKNKCEDINECITNTTICATPNTTCVNEEGGHVCKELCPGLCDQLCEEKENGYQCSCRQGYRLDGRYRCEDIDECNSTTSNYCHNSTTCINLNGTYTCQCPPGFQGNGTLPCTDVNNCLLDNSTCHRWADCINTIGGEECRCKEGYYGDGITCFRDLMTTPSTVIVDNSNIGAIVSSLNVLQLKVNNTIINISDSAQELTNTSSPLRQIVITWLQSFLYDVYVIVNNDVISVNVISLRVDTSPRKRRTTQTIPSLLQVEYVVKYTNKSTDTNQMTREVIEQIIEDDNTFQQPTFFAKLTADPLTAQSPRAAGYNPCTTFVKELKHQCDEHASCTQPVGVNSYFCTCNRDYIGTGFECVRYTPGVDMLVALVIVVVGLVVLLGVMTLFLRVRQQNQQRLSFDANSITSDVSWSSPMFGGMQNRELYSS